MRSVSLVFGLPLVAALFLSSPGHAETLPGLDDPAFRKPFERLLLGHDLPTLADLHAAAEAGNHAAVLAMPFALSWARFDPAKTRPAALFKINGQRVNLAAMALDPLAALWWQDATSDPADLLDRARAFYLAGETARGNAMLATWLNQTGGLGPLPDWLFDSPVPSWLTAALMRYRLKEITDAVPPQEADALVILRLQADDPAAWMALAGYADMDRPDPSPLPDEAVARIAAILTAAGVAPEDGQRRMAEAVPLLLASSPLRDDPLDADTAAASVAALKGTPEFLPVETVCATACPQTAETCMVAFVAAFGNPMDRTVQELPFASLISPAAFFATRRGQTELFRSVRFQMGENPAISPAMVQARQIDACLADAALSILP
ncbi:MAG: hypothetical protein WAS26_20635 [Paracoccaceae bacterium]